MHDGSSRERRAQEALLLELAAIDATNFRQALRRILALDARALGVERVSFWNIERPPLALTCKLSYLASEERYDRELPIAHRHAPGYFAAIQEARVIGASDAWADPRTSELRESYLEPRGITSMLDAPVYLRGHLAGVLCHEHVGAARPWTDREKDLAVFAAHALGRVLEGRARTRATFLADATALLNDNLDFAEVPHRLARLAIPVLGHWCTIDVFDEGGLRQLAAAHVDPQKRELLDELTPPRSGVSFASVRAARSGESVLRRGLTPEVLAEASGDRSQVEVLLAAGTGEILSVPLVAHGGVLGALTCGAGSERDYDADDLELARNLSERAGVAIENAKLHLDLRQALELRDEFLSIAAHELFTPIHSLQLALEALSGEHLQLSEATARRSIRIAQRQVRRLRGLVGDLLSVTRIQRGRLALALEEVDLAHLVREVIDELDREIERCGSEIELNLEEPLVGRWDRERLEQVVANLLGNALKFGGGQPITIRLGQKGESARLSIHDRGLSIDPDDLQRIFEPFHRAVSARKYGGLGIGLYIAQQIVRALGGELSADSAPEQGSTFYVRLPLSGPEQGAGERGAEVR